MKILCQKVTTTPMKKSKILWIVASTRNKRNTSQKCQQLFFNDKQTNGTYEQYCVNKSAKNFQIRFSSIRGCHQDKD